MMIRVHLLNPSAMTLIYIPQVRFYLGWEPSELSGWWLEMESGFTLHLGRLELVVK